VKRTIIIVLDLLTVAAILALWQGLGPISALTISTPLQVAEALGKWATSPYLLGNVGVTLWESFAGLVVAVVVAVILAFVLTSSRTLVDFVAPFVSVLNAVPKVALAPLFLVVFGIGIESKIYFIAASVFFIPFFSMYRALTSIDPVFEDNLRTLGGGRWWLIREVKVPAIIATTIASLRVTVVFALTGAIVSELISSQSGIGYQISQAQNALQPDMLVASVLVVVILAVIMDVLLRLLERRYSNWKLA
jgi:NitT/TauT family transport system permease protein